MELHPSYLFKLLSDDLKETLIAVLELWDTNQHPDKARVKKSN